MSFPIAVEPAPGAVARVLEAIRLEEVGVRYDAAWNGPRSFKARLTGAREKARPAFEALRSISLSVEKGEILGIIGANGSGKTTLLRVMARVLEPTSGRVRVRGRVVALLDLLCGFHPELTGRENLYLQGAFIGLSRRDVDRSLDGIIAFADLGSFIDAPLRTYSAGMTLRLAFALLTTVEAEVMLIDEALAVGDAEFQRKCERRLENHRERGATFIVVSHDVLRIRDLADRVLWLDQGSIRMIGAPHAVVTAYIESLR